LLGPNVQSAVRLARYRVDDLDWLDPPPRRDHLRLADAGRTDEHGSEGRGLRISQTSAPARPWAAVRSWVARARREPAASRRASGSRARASPLRRAADPP